VLVTAMTVAGGQALANTCQADRLICPTTMPVGGFCQCSAHGTTMSGTVSVTAAPSEHYNSTAGGCGSHPDDPGCRAMPMQPAATPMPPPPMQPPSMQPPPGPPPG